MNVNILFWTSLLYFLLILPIIQTGLGWAYFKFGHPWKRIMEHSNEENEEVFEMNPMGANDQGQVFEEEKEEVELHHEEEAKLK